MQKQPRLTRSGLRYEIAARAIRQLSKYAELVYAIRIQDAQMESLVKYESGDWVTDPFGLKSLCRLAVPKIGRYAMRFTLIVAMVTGPAALAQTVDFTRDVAPMFAQCKVCHGAQQQMSGLRLDQRESALQGGNAGALLKSGNSAESRLIDYLTGAKSPLNPRGLKMPMGGAPFPEKDLATIRAWIDGGAQWPASQSASAKASQQDSSLSWSFRPVKRPAIPSVQNRLWVRNPIDAFILARLEAAAVAPSPEAERTTLIRRVSMDLIGLPPTAEDVKIFVSDARPDAYERLVDRLLGSPHFGETWGRFWLDQARYADTEGHEVDRAREYGWRYRNWVIDSYNRDQPFDQFTIEQIAGDLLPKRTTEQWVATGFHRNSLVDREGGTDPALSEFDRLMDRTNAVANAWLALSIGCAQCHNHKFDPVTQKEYYQFAAFINSFKEIDIDAPLAGEMGAFLRTQAEYRQKRGDILKVYEIAEFQAEWEKELRQTSQNPGKRGDWDIHWLRIQIYVDNGREILLQIPPEKRTWEEAEAVTDFFVKLSAEGIGQKRYSELKLRDAAGKLATLKAKYPQLTQAQAMVERTFPVKNHVHLGGEYNALGIEVQPGVPASVNPLPTGVKLTRLSLARWLVSPDNPLTRRVAVNRIWQELFGRGIVFTSEDLGAQGSKATHPDLLDWLSSEFLDLGWSRKQIIREIVTSATYRQKSEARPELSQRDPENELLARQSRRRLSAEGIRDVALAASGLLDTRIGGPSVRPYQPNIGDAAYGRGDWMESEGGDRYRRGLYTFFKRANPYPGMINFDAPNANISVCRRSRSNTPLQALGLLNDPVFFEAAQALAAGTLRASPGATFTDRLNYAYEATLGRLPSGREQERLLSFFHNQREILAKDSQACDALFPYSFDGIDRIEGSAWVNLSSVLLNLDEFITKE